MSLEEGAHLRVSSSRTVEDEKVDFEAKGVGAEGNDDEAEDTRDPMADVGAL